MSRFYVILSIFIFCFLSFFSFTIAKADETVVTTTTTQSDSPGATSKVIKTTRQVIVTPVPAAKEVIATPAGYETCFTVDAGWFNNIWVPTHRVCQYQNTAQGVAWVEGYWECNQATDAGVCTNWQWRQGRWEKSLVVY